MEEQEQAGWLSMTAESVLHVVPTANYLRYGPAGVRRFGPNAIERDDSHPHTVMVRLTGKNPQGEVLFEYENWLLHHTEPDQPFDLEGTTIWAGIRPEEQLRLVWVWDFYRMYSGVKLDVQLPAGPDAPAEKSPWQQAYQHISALSPGDQLVLSAESASGDLLQVYPINRHTLKTP